MYISDSNSVHSVSTDSEQNLSPSPRNSASVSDINLQDITEQLGEIQADLLNSSIVSTVNSNSANSKVAMGLTKVSTLALTKAKINIQSKIVMPT